MVFHNDDDAYESWVGRHGGYVLTERSRNGEFMLHDSDCSHLAKDNDIKLTAKPRRWARYRADLETWVVAETGDKPLLCRTCM